MSPRLSPSSPRSLPNTWSLCALNTEAFGYDQYKYNALLIHHCDDRLSLLSYFVWVFSAPASCAHYCNGILYIVWAFQFSQSLHNIQKAILTNHSEIILKTKAKLTQKAILANHPAIMRKTESKTNSKGDTCKSLFNNGSKYRKDNTAHNKRWFRLRSHLSGRSL